MASGRFPCPVSPKSLAPGSLPRGEWDEWYVFEAEAVGMRSRGVRELRRLLPSAHDPGNEWQQATVERFWGQLAEWWAESYLAEGDNLICVTRQEAVVPELVRAFSQSIRQEY